MRRRDNQIRCNRNLTPNSGTHRMNLVIDNVPSRTAPCNTSQNYYTAPTSLLTASASERWSNGNQFPTQSTNAIDTTFAFRNVNDDDNHSHYSESTVVGWNSQADKQFPSLSQLDQESYSPTHEDTEALEEAWTEYTSSQSQSSQSQLTDLGYSSQVQDVPVPSPTSSNTTTASPDPLLSQSFTSASEQDEEATVSQQSSPYLVGRVTIPVPLEKRLELVWPQLPIGLESAPLPVAWEFMRAALHCSLNPAYIDVQYDEKWVDQRTLWASLKAHSAFEDHELPDMCDARAWNCSMNSNFRSGSRAAVLTASTSLSPYKTGPVLLLELHPLKYEQSCRLHRRFGSDRFLELRMPELDVWKSHGLTEEVLRHTVSRWLTNDIHHFLGRDWAGFWVRNEGRRLTRKTSEVSLEPEETVGFEKVSFFAVDGVDFISTQESLLTSSDHSTTRIRCTRNDMLQWLLQFDKNGDEPYLKFFSRVSLGLTKATPVIIFQQDQLRHHNDDIRSSTRQKMNDGIGRISNNVMRKIRDELGFTETPCAIQARIGSAKGMWIVDVEDSGQEDWIETYPSQRKWKCDWSDESHRTLEIKACVAPLRPANLNLQFLPILEDRAIDKLRMRDTIGKQLAVELGKDLEVMKVAIKHPELFRQWVQDSSIHRENRIRQHEVPFLAGLPDAEQDKMAFLADGGFDPMQQKYLQDIVYLYQRKKCQRLENDLKIKIPRSTYAFMVVDFLGVLAPNEVHLCFSSRFGDGPDEYRDLDGIDVLVARSPAHLPSDIQKVRAVYKPELRRLRDVIIFPRTGLGPLADTLSGGDYDGDKAWVCWEPEIVGNFESVSPPPKPEFSLEKDEIQIKSFLGEDGEHYHIDMMIERAFTFNLKSKLLGMCTSYKEKLSYHYNSISNKSVIALSWLLSELADQAKSGIIFDFQHWRTIRHQFVGEKRQLPEPAYKRKTTSRWGEASHIIDYLMFVVAKGVIEDELESLTKFYKLDPANTYDDDVAGYWNYFEKALGKPDRNGISRATWFINLREDLMDELRVCFDEWNIKANPKDYRPNVLRIYDQWQKIEPSVSASSNDERHFTDAVNAFLLQNETHHSDLNHWQLLKASMTLKMFHKIGTKFVWQMAGRQLQFIKAMHFRDSSAPIPVVSNLYAALRPDNKYIKRVMAKGDNSRDATEFYVGDVDDDDEFQDAEEWFIEYPDLELELAELDTAIGDLSVV